jgi:hypothetical protein
MIREEKANKNLNDEAAKYMENFFTTGVEFNPYVFNQPRMT